MAFLTVLHCHFLNNLCFFMSQGLQSAFITTISTEEKRFLRQLDVLLPVNYP